MDDTHQIYEEQYKTNLCVDHVLYGSCKNYAHHCPYQHRQVVRDNLSRDYYQRVMWLFQVLPLDQVEAHMQHITNEQRCEYCLMCNIYLLYPKIVHKQTNPFEFFDKDPVPSVCRRCPRLFLTSHCTQRNCPYCYGKRCNSDDFNPESIKVFITSCYLKMKQLGMPLCAPPGATTCSNGQPIAESLQHSDISDEEYRHRHFIWDDEQQSWSPNEEIIKQEAYFNPRTCFMCRSLPHHIIFAGNKDSDQSITDHPDEILDIIFDYVGKINHPIVPLRILYGTCRKFRRILRDPRYWRNVCLMPITRVPEFYDIYNNVLMINEYKDEETKHNILMGEAVQLVKENQKLLAKINSNIDSLSRIAIPEGSDVEITRSLSNGMISYRLAKDDEGPSDTSNESNEENEILWKRRKIIGVEIVVQPGRIFTEYTLDNYQRLEGKISFVAGLQTIKDSSTDEIKNMIDIDQINPRHNDDSVSSDSE